MKYLLTRLSLFSFVLLIAANCSEDSKTNSIPESGKFEMTLNSEKWSATEANAVFATSNDTSAMFIGATKIPTTENDPISAVTIMVMNTTSANLVGDYSIILESPESENETELKKGVFIFYTDGNEGYWICTSGSFKVIKAKDNVAQATFEGVLTEVVDMVETSNLAKSPFSIPKYKLGTRQLNAVMTVTDGGFNLNYTSMTDMEF